jgi:hypothetical protein
VLAEILLRSSLTKLLLLLEESQRAVVDGKKVKSDEVE